MHCQSCEGRGPTSLFLKYQAPAPQYGITKLGFIGQFVQTGCWPSLRKPQQGRHSLASPHSHPHSLRASAAMPPSRPVAAHPTISNSRKLDIGDVLGACVGAARRSCEVIRKVNSARIAGGAIGTSFKDVSDPRSALTIADVMAQAAIVEPLSKQFPGLKIVAEEDEDVGDENDAQTHSPLSTSCDGLQTPECYRSVPIDDICIFCDPLDGTLEFVEGRLEAVQTLIGISVRGEPVAGVIGRPFVNDAPIYGMVGAGVVNLEQDLTSKPPRQGIVLSSSHSRLKPALEKAMQVIDPASVLPLGGAGNKMLHVANGAADMCILNLVTSLWDTAATSAIIKATGGTVTDLFGNPIRHYSFSRLQNCYGVLASGKQLPEHDVKGRTHKDVCAELRRSGVLDTLLQGTGLQSNGQPQATDIALDIDGNPIRAEWLSEVLEANVIGFSADDSSAVRYLMSDACRLKLVYEDKDAAGPKSVFMKRIVMQDLEHVKLKARTAPQKLERDVTSYQVEAAFLSSLSCQEFCEAGARIARSFHIDSRPASGDRPPIESKFLLMLEDFSPDEGWYQSGLLGKDELLCALDALAGLHAFYWNYSAEGSYGELSDSVWDQATYWVPSRQAPDSFEKLPSAWINHRKNFASELEKLEVEPEQLTLLHNLGEALAVRALDCAKQVHDVGLNEKHPHRTIIHGDAKAANFFFRQLGRSPVKANEGSQGDLEVGMIDFQWCGWGHPAVDVAYLIASSASPTMLTHDGSGELVLLQEYYARFCQHMIKFKKAPTRDGVERLISFNDFEQFYRYAFLDLCRLVFSYHWDRIRASPAVLSARKDMLGSNSYNKDLDCALWLISRCASLLAKNTWQ